MSPWASSGPRGTTAPTSASVTVTGFTLGSFVTYDAGSFYEAVYMFYKYATGSDSGSYTVNDNTVAGASVDEGDILSARITGGPTSGNPFVDTFQSATNTTATTAVMSSFTPGGDNSLLLALLWVDNSSTATFPGGWTTDTSEGSGVPCRPGTYYTDDCCSYRQPDFFRRRHI
ncbi:MAG: hypothetical protein WDN27_04235 [Candidatus Saccharibacteria bacterium]